MVKIGIVGIYRGASFYKNARDCKVVAICDNNVEILEKVKKEMNADDVTFYTDFDEFLNHDMDGVVLANFANEHAPFAIKAMKAGKHVLSEVLPCECMAQAVELIETVEETGKIYSYAENYCYMPAPREMKAKFESGELGTFEYGEGEYIHNCESIWPQIAYGDPTHWRNYTHGNFYCTHSLGPLLHISGLRPVKVCGFSVPPTSRTLRMGRLSDTMGMEIVTLENGAIIKSIHGDLVKNNIWYSVYGSKGHLESTREIVDGDDSIQTIYKNIDSNEGVFDGKNERYRPVKNENEKDSGHGGSDLYPVNNFAKKIAGEDAEIIDVYEAVDMGICGILAYRSARNGGVSIEVPNLRLKEERDKYRNDYECCNKKVAKDQWVPSSASGILDIPQETYEIQKQKFKEYLENEKKSS